MFGRINSFYLFIGVLFVTLLTVNTQYFKGSNAFLGVTYAKKYQINAELPALIEQTHVVPGQTVAPGDLLVELYSPALELEIKKLQKEIQNLQSEKTEKQKLLDSELQLLEAEKRIISNEMSNEIELLENQISLNRSITKDLLSETTIYDDSTTSMRLQIKSLRERGNLELGSVDISIQDLKQDHQFDQSQIQANIELAQQELDWKLDEQQNLNKYASFSGVIDNVYVKPGEQVEAFTSVVSINPVHPATVIGYLVGSKDRDRGLGEQVEIQSLEQPNIATTGTIIGFGSIVQLPTILQKSTAVSAFGLEVFIEISDENRLPVGEKVMIK